MGARYHHSFSLHQASVFPDPRDQRSNSIKISIYFQPCCPAIQFWCNESWLRSVWYHKIRFWSDSKYKYFLSSSDAPWTWSNITLEHFVWKESQLFVRINIEDRDWSIFLYLSYWCQIQQVFSYSKYWFPHLYHKPTVICTQVLWTQMFSC